MEFSTQAWNKISQIYNAILNLQFLRELEDGSLSRDIFQYYLIQDAIYLGEFARVLAIISAKAPTPESQLQFARSVQNALEVERTLHENFLAEFGLVAEEVLKTEPSPTCLNYTNFLIATAYQNSFAVTVAAILPCFWIYSEVGKQIHHRAISKANPYQKWIDTYADAEFEELVKYVIEVVDRTADKASRVERELMSQAFYRASQLEWMFWDSSYRLEQWSVN